ncbi:MAG: ROK family protein [Bacillota bacterium]|nr:ROK family protein [Bacillota bacterium]
MIGIKLALGIDIGGTTVKLGLIDQDGLVVSSISFSSKLSQQQLWSEILRQSETMLRKHNIEWDMIIGAGIGIPGLVDTARHFVHSAPNLGWTDYHLQPILADLFPVPYKIENDANLAALGEFWAGAGKGKRSLVMITVGTGIGSGFITNGQIYRGEGVATEMGHMVIDPNGPACCCGSWGCLESLAASPALIRNMTNLLGENKQGEVVKPTVREIFSMAREGNELAKKAIKITANYLGIGIANIVNIFNPEVILLGGGVSEGGELFLEPMLAEVRRRALGSSLAKTSIIPAALKNKAGIVGGGALFWLAELS